MARARHRSLNHRRTRYRPGLGYCSCKPCREEAKARRDAGEDYNHGEPFDRCEYVNREQVFAERWEDENQPRPGINFGMGILQDLMVRQADGLWTSGCGRRVAFWVSKRERVIVATVIQWLGTNCGWCFLEECVRACGFRLVPDDQPLPRPRPRPDPPPPIPAHLGRFVHLVSSRDRGRRRGQGGAEGVE